jgi:mutator protein MutT
VIGQKHRLDVVIAIVTRGGKVLICQRPAGKSFAGYWEFPGGKREPGETLEACLARELLEELAIRVTPVRALTTIDHDYPRGPIRLHPFVCAHEAGEPQLLAVQDARWVEPAELRHYRFPPANDALIEETIGSLSAPPPG